ncbi:MAG TPA: hypothetical protein VKR52_00990 [Terracidiphilus sp.]|nr:hypothetical protein [Terracidiphilus sp.]
MQQKMKGIVPTPYQMPERVQEQRKTAPRAEAPLLIRLFAWLCFLRAGIYVAFGLIVGGMPDSSAAAYLALHFDSWPKQIPAEFVFYISAALYCFIGWRWATRDWRARWAAMFVTGATVASVLVHLSAGYASGSMTPMPAGQQGALVFGIIFNLAIFGYLAFYPGMAQAFKETPWD